MKKHQAFPGKFLKAADFEQGSRNLTIKKVGFDKVNEDESKLVVYFREEDLGLVLNKTNFNIIEEISGKTDTDDWAGTVLTVGRVKVDYQGQRVWGVRVMEAGADVSKSATRTTGADVKVETPDDEEIPF